MKTKDGFIQGYNAQAAVDATAQVIVATASTRSRAININWRRWPTHRSQSGQEADATVGGRGLLLRRQPYGDGEREIDAYIAPGRAHAGEGEGGGVRVAAMREESRPAGLPPTA